MSTKDQLPLVELVIAWVSHLEQVGYSRATIAAYRLQVDKLVGYLADRGATTGTDLSRGVVRDFLLGVPGGCATQQHLRAAARSFLRYLEGAGVAGPGMVEAITSFRRGNIHCDRELEKTNGGHCGST